MPSKKSSTAKTKDLKPKKNPTGGAKKPAPKPKPPAPRPYVPSGSEKIDSWSSSDG